MSTTPCTNSAALLASLVALVATMRTAVAPACRIDWAYWDSTPSVRARASGEIRPVASTPWPSRTISMRRCTSVSSRRARLTSAMSSRSEFVPQSMAATRRARSPPWPRVRGPGPEVIHRAARRRARRRCRRAPRSAPGGAEVRAEVGVGDARARRPPRTSRLDGLPAERVAAGHGELVRDQRVQALDAVRHAARAGRGGRERLQARGLPGRGPAVHVVLVGRPVAVAQLGVGPQPLGHGPHDPGRLQPADGRGGPRAGQVVQRRERGAVGQPGRGLHHVGQAARAAVGDGHHPARRAAELARDHGHVTLGHGHRAVIGWRSGRRRAPTTTAVRTTASRRCGRRRPWPCAWSRR